ncbi:MAG: helix-turn-helix domain-containing protein [Alicyclobacillus sp.]|nr:helix-turn-helix domain-containing protein [Alicyclobacillus sp.]
MRTLGQKIREARLQRGLTQHDLAGNLVTASMISQIEADRANPSFTLLRSIADRLGLDVRYFLTDMDDKYITTARLKLVQYHLLSGDLPKALEALDEIERPETPGENLHLYLCVKATALRLAGQFVDAVHLVEELREQAYRTMDKPLLVQVHRESGYIEYAMNNFQGAMMEWREAARLGEELLETPVTDSVELGWDLTDVYLSLADLCQQTGDDEEARGWLNKAHQLAGSAPLLKRIADTYVRAAHVLLDDRLPGPAHSAAEKALAVMGAARQVERQIVILARLQDESAPSAESLAALPLDDWSYSAIETSGTDPVEFLDTEVNLLETWIRQGNLERARDRMERASKLMEGYRHQLDAEPNWYAALDLRLKVCQADWLHASGKQNEAAIQLQTVLKEADPLDDDLRRQLFSRLLGWYAEMGKVDEVVKLTEQLRAQVQDDASIATL